MNMSLTDRFRLISLAEYQLWFHTYGDSLYHCSPFHHPLWLEAAAAGVGFETVYVGVYTGQELTAVIPGFVTRRGPLKFFGSPLRGAMTSYLGPVSLSPAESFDAQVELITQASQFIRKQLGVVFTRFTLRDAPAGPEPTLAGNWHRARSGSYRLDLTRGCSAVWQGLNQGCRRNIRKAQKLGMTLVPLASGRQYYAMVDATFRLHGSTSFQGRQFYEALLTRLEQPNLMWAWGAQYEGEIIAGGLFLHDDRELHYISGASLPQYRTLPTSYLLYWRAIELAAECGLQVFNSDVSRVRSIDSFKESFRPVLERRYVLTWTPSYLRAAQKVYMDGYARFRSIKSRLKLPALRR